MIKSKDQFNHTTPNMVVTISGFKGLRSLELCGGLITDAGVKNIKDLKDLTLLNLSQNGNLTDKTLEIISGTCIFHISFFHLPRTSDMIITVTYPCRRPDRFGLAEPVELPGVQRRSPPSEAAAEPALAVARLVQGDGLRDQEASAGRPPQPGKRAAGVVR